MYITIHIYLHVVKILMMNSVTFVNIVLLVDF